MAVSRRIRFGLSVAMLGILVAAGAGCGLFSRSRDTAAEVPASPPPPAAAPLPAPLPVPIPVPTPPPPPRASGARIADEESLRNLIQGKTTKAEVRARFGIPQEIVLSPGVETFIYYRDRSSGWFSRASERVETLTVRFDAKGILKDFEYRYAGR